MPYITQERRDMLDEEIEVLQDAITSQGDKPGDLNYALSRLVGRVWMNTPRYKTICVVIGTLVCVALEFYRRVAGGYEDKAIRENYDIIEYRGKREAEAVAATVAECGGCADAPVEFEPEVGENEYDECGCGRELLGVHLKEVHDGDS